MKKPKKIKKPVARREIEVGLRLREAREFLNLSQKEFAERIGIKRVRLASYEAGRVPLRWEVALRACQRLLISECWLATGFDRPEGGKFAPFGNTIARAGMFQPGDPVLEHLKPGSLFSQAYDSYLQQDYWNRLVVSARSHRRGLFSYSGDIEGMRGRMEWALTKWFSLIQPSHRARFCEGIVRTGGLLFETLYAPTDGSQIPSSSPIEKTIEENLKKQGIPIPEK